MARLRTAALASVLLASALTATAPQARAQTASDKAAAEELFAEGRKLMAAHKYAEACPKFVASLRLDRGVGTMLNLADCYEQNGQTASAWAEFREASSAARDAGSVQREQLARDRARALEPRLSRLTISLEGGGAAGVQVKRDGEAIDPALLGTQVPVDPGKHVIEASSAGKKPWSSTVQVGSNGAQVAVTIPRLEDDASAAATTAQPAGAAALGGAASFPAGGSAARGADAGTSPGSPGHGQRTAALVAGGVGVVGLAVGTVFGLGAKSKWDSADGACPSRFNCSQSAVDDQTSASSQATIATIGFIAGGIGIAAGALLWLTAPRESSTAPSAEHAPSRVAGGPVIDSVGVGPRGVFVSGTF